VGYVERNAGGCTELRVHGVAGTPPEAVLQHPHAEQVAGNRDAGFFRRWWEGESVSEDSPRRRREAYSWGGLTSGDNLRALWLLLLPFMLLNVAFYMSPYRRPPEPDGRPRAVVVGERVLDRFSAGVQRLLALSFTATFTLTAIAVAMDLVGWQCAAAPTVGDVCGTSWLSWLDRPGLQPGQQVAIAALLPLAVVGLLWWLAGATWDRYERVKPPPSDTTVRPVEVRTPLEDRAMWNGRGPVRRLRAVHVATGLALPGVFALAPVRSGGTPWWLVLLALLGFLLAMVAAVAHPGIARRERPTTAGAVQEKSGERRSPFRLLPWCAVGLTALGLAVAATTAETAPVTGTLPWMVGTLQWLFAAQAGLLLLLLVACLLLTWRARKASRRAGNEFPVREEGDEPVEVRWAWRGLAMPSIALLAWVLAGGFSAGTVLRTAQTLGTPVAPGYLGSDPYPLVVPLAYQWLAAAAFALAVVAVLTALLVWRRLRRWKQMQRAVEEAYGAPATSNDGRTAQIARAWAQASELTGELRRALGFLLAVTAVVVAVSGVAFLLDKRVLVAERWVVTAGNTVLSLFVLGLLWVGRQAYRNPAQRRTVGIVWDLGTFWPRAVHPLAPPCYAERAVPDLIGRLQYLTGTGEEGAEQGTGTVLLSCHSQGSVLGAVVLMQTETTTSARTAFLTYGCPLARLYGRFFPAYFSPQALDRLGGFLHDPRSGAHAAGRRAGWRWRNLHRPSDPIGGAVFVEHALLAGRAWSDTGDVDQPLQDPVFARRPGDPCYPPIRGHSNYFADPAFARTADALLRGALTSRPAADTTYAVVPSAVGGSTGEAPTVDDRDSDRGRA
jgi:hypothetical protein